MYKAKKPILCPPFWLVRCAVSKAALQRPATIDNGILISHSQPQLQTTQQSPLPCLHTFQRRKGFGTTTKEAPFGLFESCQEGENCIQRSSFSSNRSKRTSQSTTVQWQFLVVQVHLASRFLRRNKRVRVV